jgi:hypothetical protein
MPTFTQDVDIQLYDHEVEIELTADDIADEYNHSSDFADLMDTLNGRHPTHMADWLLDNSATLPIPPQRTLTDQQIADLDHAATMLDAIQTLLGLGDASALAMRLREIKVTYVEMIQA